MDPPQVVKKCVAEHCVYFVEPMLTHHGAMGPDEKLHIALDLLGQKLSVTLSIIPGGPAVTGYVDLVPYEGNPRAPERVRRLLDGLGEQLQDLRSS